MHMRMSLLPDDLVLAPQMTHHRHFPQNVYVVLYNYKPRQADELDLK